MQNNIGNLIYHFVSVKFLHSHARVFFFFFFFEVNYQMFKIDLLESKLIQANALLLPLLFAVLRSWSSQNRRSKPLRHAADDDLPVKNEPRLQLKSLLDLIERFVN